MCRELEATLQEGKEGEGESGLGMEAASRPRLRANLTFLLLTTDQKAFDSAQDTNRTVCMSPREEQEC